MDTDRPGSFLDINAKGNESQPRNMFGNESRLMSASQSRAAIQADIEDNSREAVINLRIGVRLNKFIDILKNVKEFKLNENDREVAAFLTSLEATVKNVAAGEENALFLEEERWNKQLSVAFRLLTLRASRDLLTAWLEAPNRVNMYCSHLYVETDPFSPRNSGFRIRLARVEGGSAGLKKLIAQTMAEVSPEDIVDHALYCGKQLLGAIAPSWIDPPLSGTPSEDEIAEWVARVNQETIKTREGALEFISQLEGMKNWSIDQTISYLRNWSEKAKLTNVFALDHQSETPIITIQNNGELRALGIRWSQENNRYQVERVRKPNWCYNWRVVTEGRNLGEADGGFRPPNAYKRPAPSRPGYGKRGRGGMRR
ncbi:Oidioi.mRNA.OKI2018_I69.YSR.g17111.t1.cds [Oikopleura dioica]|uniref:Oidioi.mRNA.OKI2018_I69.YSR.g17111.t1.cds n=1 Tax=Oikopleura dioica TaxID=34765 RepID=A0ABN7SI68_OIKDI|nr:Oidioi.mRNA.OKI2018_I69.YSR.g17111.t1.cds [Oikopleura dioica]